MQEKKSKVLKMENYRLKNNNEENGRTWKIVVEEHLKNLKKG